MPSIIGIDLGTTHSLAAIWRDDRAVLIPNALDETLTPSCVSIDGDGSILVGRPAHETERRCGQRRSHGCSAGGERRARRQRGSATAARASRAASP